MARLVVLFFTAINIVFTAAMRVHADESDSMVLARRIASAPATDAEFLRRVYLAWHGIVPTAERVREFLADEAADKRAALIDELLADPRFAIHPADIWDDYLIPAADDPTAYQHGIPQTLRMMNAPQLFSPRGELMAIRRMVEAVSSQTAAMEQIDQHVLARQPKVNRIVTPSFMFQSFQKGRADATSLGESNDHPTPH